MGDSALMWEVRAADGKVGDVIAWIEGNVVPFLSHRQDCRAVDVYRSAQNRAVVIAHFDGEPVDLPEPPDELLARPVHQWPFERVHSRSWS